jgi:hypothetical protein
MNRFANITSTDAVRAFKLAMERYEAEVRDIAVQLHLEVRRAIDWIEHDRTLYWPNQMRKASDALAAARAELERQELAIRQSDKRSATDAKIAFEAARRRLRLTEEKVRAVRKWRVAAKREADDFLGEVARLTNYLDGEFPRAVAALERMAGALDKYTGVAAPTAAGEVAKDESLSTET